MLTVAEIIAETFAMAGKTKAGKQRKPRKHSCARRPKAPNGVIVYEGPSRIDGKPIVVIATGLLKGRKSKNGKTGAMVQTWIIRADIDPLTALRTGQDVSICGGCIHRPKDWDGTKWYQRSCYVRVDTAVMAIWRAYKAGSYARATIAELATMFADMLVRFGAYGDPAAVPVIYWQTIANVARGTTGYTHQWRSARLRDVLSYCQVSADSETDVASARALGVGSFRVKTADAPALPGEIVCPASAEAGKVTTCADCRMCDGASGKNIVIDAHGIGAGSYKPRASRALTVLAA